MALCCPWAKTQHQKDHNRSFRYFYAVEYWSPQKYDCERRAQFY